MNDQPTLDDATIELFRRIRDLSINPHGNIYQAMNEIFTIAQGVLHDHAPEFKVVRDYLKTHGSKPK